MNTSKPDLHQQVTDRIIAHLEKGVVPWRKPWGFEQPAQNHFSGHVYRGVNFLYLNTIGADTPYFGTIKQINEAGGRVKKGATAEAVYFNDYLYYLDKKRITYEHYKSLSEGLKSKVKTVYFLRMYPVFNMSQVEGVDVKPFIVPNYDLEKIEECEIFLGRITDKPTILEGGNKAYYMPSKDHIQMPYFEAFKHINGYYATLFHELAHSTGHGKRLNRDFATTPAPFGSPDYSKEELVAEIASCMLCNHLQINTPQLEENTAAYIGGWLSRLKDDKNLIFEAAAKAQAAFMFFTLQVEANSPKLVPAYA